MACVSAGVTGPVGDGVLIWVLINNFSLVKPLNLWGLFVTHLSLLDEERLFETIPLALPQVSFIRGLSLFFCPSLN
jgi:hypothetical protein